MTQSLGNMVACEALREGLQVGQYYMFDAAIPSEAIDETLRANPPWLLAGLDESWANYCWQKQETLKGSRLPAGTAYGGWRFHIWTTTIWNDGEQRWDGVITNYTPAAAAAMVADGSITNNPVFNRGFSPMFDCNASLDDQWLAVAKYVPAVSSPVGGNAVTFGNKIENHDLNSSDYRNGWGRPAVDDKTDWHHSDMKDMAYFYVYKLYEQLIQKGDLK